MQQHRPPLAFPFLDLLSSDEFTSRRISPDYLLPIKVPFPFAALDTQQVDKYFWTHPPASTSETRIAENGYMFPNKANKTTVHKFYILEILYTRNIEFYFHFC